MDWDDLRYLLAIARAGTLNGASRRLNVDQTTVTRHLGSAEAALGARLFERTAGTLRPTVAGAEAIERALRIEREIEGLGASSLPEVIRLTAVPILVARLLVPALPALLAANPDLRIDLIAESRALSLTRGEADIALRLTRPESGAALTRRLGQLDYAVYRPTSVGSDELPWIAYEDGLAHLPHARWLASAPGPKAALAVNDAEPLLEAIAAGLGKSLLPCFVGDADPRLDREGQVVLSREIWSLVRPDLRGHAVLDWLAGLAVRGSA